MATKGEPVSLVACHDEYSMWFDLIPDCNLDVPLPMPQPQPGLQMAMSRYQQLYNHTLFPGSVISDAEIFFHRLDFYLQEI